MLLVDKIVDGLNIKHIHIFQDYIMMILLIQIVNTHYIMQKENKKHLIVILFVFPSFLFY